MGVVVTVHNKNIALRFMLIQSSSASFVIIHLKLTVKALHGPDQQAGSKTAGVHRTPKLSKVQSCRHGVDQVT